MIAKEWISTTEENVSKTNTRMQSQHLEKVRHAEYSTKGFPGEGPISMTLTDKFFQCPTIMGQTWVKAVMNKTRATIIINQMKILRSTSKYKNARKKDGTPRPKESPKYWLLPNYDTGTRIEIK